MNSHDDHSRDHGGGEATTSAAARMKPILQILEHSVREFRLHAEPSEIRHAILEATRTWPGTAKDRWWKWLVEAGESLDFRVSVVECPLEEALWCVEEGMHLGVFLPGQSNPWLVVDELHRGKFRVFQPGVEKTVRWVRRSELKRLLGCLDETAAMQYVTFEPALSCDPEHHEQELQSGRTLKPFARTLLILRAEWSDIWVLLVFAVVSGVLALAAPMAVQTMVSLVSFGRLLQPVVVLSLMLLGLMLFQSALRLWETYIAEVIQRRLFARVTHDLSYRLPRVRQEAIDGEYGPELTNRFFDVLTLQKATAQFLVDVVDLVMVSLIGMVVLAVYHPLLLGLDVILLTFTAIIIFVLGRGGVRTSIQESKYKYSTAAWLDEIARCPLTFRMDNASEFSAEKSEQFVLGYLEHRRLHFRVLFRQIVFGFALYAIAGSVQLGVGGWLVIQDKLTLGQLVAAEMIVAIVVGALTKMGKHLEAFYDLMAGIDKLGVLFDLPLEPQDGLMRLPVNRPAELEVRDVSYLHNSCPVLQSLRCEIGSGQRIAIVGPAGCGKSTLADLIYGIRRPAQGHLVLDGHDLRDVRPDVWRRHVMLLRSVELFQGTALDNVHMEHPDIDVRLVRTACEKLGLMDANVLPNGLETVLSPTGAPLSDSQARRLVLARALVHRPRLLVIDGLLDPISDDVLEPILDLLFDREQPWTLVVISSRSSILRRCDSQLNLASNQMSTPLEPLHPATE